jgi:hypothetical protein
MILLCLTPDYIIISNARPFYSTSKIELAISGSTTFALYSFTPDRLISQTVGSQVEVGLLDAATYLSRITAKSRNRCLGLFYYDANDYYTAPLH